MTKSFISQQYCSWYTFLPGFCDTLLLWFPFHFFCYSYFISFASYSCCSTTFQIWETLSPQILFFFSSIYTCLNHLNSNHPQISIFPKLPLSVLLIYMFNFISSNFTQMSHRNFKFKMSKMYVYHLFLGTIIY